MRFCVPLRCAPPQLEDDGSKVLLQSPREHKPCGTDSGCEAWQCRENAAHDTAPHRPVEELHGPWKPDTRRWQSFRQSLRTPNGTVRHELRESCERHLPGLGLAY